MMLADQPLAPEDGGGADDPGASEVAATTAPRMDLLALPPCVLADLLARMDLAQLASLMCACTALRGGVQVSVRTPRGAAVGPTVHAAPCPLREAAAQAHASMRRRLAARRMRGPCARGRAHAARQPPGFPADPAAPTHPPHPALPPPTPPKAALSGIEEWVWPDHADEDDAKIAGQIR